MRRFQTAVFCFSMLIVAALAIPTAADAQDRPWPNIAREHHPWARFTPGVWRTTESISETLDASGDVVNRTKTTQHATLQQLQEQRYSLRQESVVDIHGRQVSGPPQLSWYSLFVDDRAEVDDVEVNRPTEIVLCGRSIRCRVMRVQLTGRERPLIAQIHYANADSPYIFRRVSYEKPLDAAASPPWQSVEEVVAVDMPFRFRGRLMLTSHVRSVTTTPKGQTVRMTVVSDEVPGGAVSAWSTELDREGTVLRRSYTELIDYDPGTRSRRRGLRRRRAQRRSQ